MLLALDVDGVILDFDGFYGRLAYDNFGATIQDKNSMEYESTIWTIKVTRKRNLEYDKRIQLDWIAYI